ncbi:hypothetical protein PT273_03615 [Orbaceae bacterium ESL0727]|nr:hypothetical protein [Orbaceae bacterium ESL0727]
MWCRWLLPTAHNTYPELANLITLTIPTLFVMTNRINAIYPLIFLDILLNTLLNEKHAKNSMILTILITDNPC